MSRKAQEMSQDIIYAKGHNWLAKARERGFSGKLLRGKAQIHRRALFFMSEWVESIYSVRGGYRT